MPNSQENSFTGKGFPFPPPEWMTLNQQIQDYMASVWKKSPPYASSFAEHPLKDMKEKFSDFCQKLEDQSLQTLKASPFFLPESQILLSRYFSFLKKVYESSLDLLYQHPSFKETDLKNTFSDHAYDFPKLWLDCCEKSYESILKHGDYQKLYGDFINAWPHWKPASS